MRCLQRVSQATSGGFFFIVVVVLIGRGPVDKSQSWRKLARAESQHVEQGKIVLPLAVFYVCLPSVGGCLGF